MRKPTMSETIAILFLFTHAPPALAEVAVPAPAEGAAGSKCRGTVAPGTTTPTPADPYPLNAAGWGGEAGGGLFISRWVEDWTGLTAANAAPPMKAVPLGGSTSLTLSAEGRIRSEFFRHPQAGEHQSYDRSLFRGVTGADLRFDRGLRVYGELAVGQVGGYRAGMGANFQNDASLQQLFVEGRREIGSALVGAMIGRQEFADGPRQLVSLSDGPNIHRTWNGVRFYAHGERLRFGAFDFRATRLGSGAFDEGVNRAERLQGINLSLIVSKQGGPNTYFEPFWLRTENPSSRLGGRVGLDRRDTYGARLWGRGGNVRFDWTAVHQSGDFMGEPTKAWGLFAVQSAALSENGWKPRLTSRVDLASGGDVSSRRGLGGFNPLYASSSYLGEGQFLSLRNLALLAPGLSVAPTSTTNFSVEYGVAKRLTDRDAVYAGQLRPYAGTSEVRGHGAGALLRAGGSWNANQQLTLTASYERFWPGAVLEQVGAQDGNYGYLGMTFRY